MKDAKYNRKNADSILAYIVFVVLASTILVAGCTSPGGPDNNLPVGTSDGNTVQQAPSDTSGNSAASGNDVAAGNGAPDNTQGNTGSRQFNGSRSGRYGGGMNLTDEQRTAMMQQRIQAEIDACSGMSEGDVCSVSISSQYGGAGGAGVARNGTCALQNSTLQNDTLMCRTNFGNGRGQFGNVSGTISQQ